MFQANTVLTRGVYDIVGKRAIGIPEGAAAHGVWFAGCLHGYMGPAGGAEIETVPRSDFFSGRSRWRFCKSSLIWPEVRCGLLAVCMVSIARSFQGYEFMTTATFGDRHH